MDRINTEEKTASKRKTQLIFSIIYLFAGIIIIMLCRFAAPDYLKKMAFGLSLSTIVVIYGWIVLNWLLKRKLSETGRRARFIAANILCAVAAIILLFTILVRVLAPTIMFHTYFAKEEYQRLQSVPDAEELVIETAKKTYSGWVLHQTEGTAPLVLYFGGNAENSAVRILRLLENPKELEPFDGYNIAFVDYPGYGKSEGSPSEKSLKEYGLAVYDALSSREDVSEVVVFAFSIGTGVANFVASERAVDKLILFAPYADGYDLYKRYVNVFYGPLRLTVPYRMEAVKFAERVQASPLIFASRQDEVIWYKSSERLIKAYPNGCKFHTLEGVLHNDIWKTDSVLQKVKEYLHESN